MQPGLRRKQGVGGSNIKGEEDVVVKAERDNFGTQDNENVGFVNTCSFCWAESPAGASSFLIIKFKMELHTIYMGM